MAQQLRVIFVMGGLDGEASGPDRIVSSLANALSRRQTPVTIYAAACKAAGFAPGMLQPPNQCRSFPGLWLGGLSWSPQLRAALDREIPDCHLVHNHSIWMLPNRAACAAARRGRKPYVITLNGTLEPYALGISRWKKRIVAAWFQNGDFRRAACLHVNTRAELRGIRAYGLRNPTAVIPNGVDLPPDDVSGSALLDRFPHLAGKRLCLFLSRLHHKKGLAPLMGAWHRTRKTYPDWHLVIAGPDCGMEAELRRMIRQFEIEESVTLTGTLLGEQKFQALAAARLFVLPSFTEGFSMAVLEALASRLPVLITEGCNFPEVQEQEAGLQVLPTADDLQRGLRQMLSATDQELARMGAKGRRLVESQYVWDEVARKMLSLYTWMQSGGAPPPFVDTL